MDTCAWCGKSATVGFGEYYRIDSQYPDKHELLKWCSKDCFDRAHARADAFGRFGKYHPRHGDTTACIGEFYEKEFPLSHLSR